MPEPSERSLIAQSPISVILLANALSTETHDALRRWRFYFESLHRPFELFLIQETRPEVADDTHPPSDDGAADGDRIKPTRLFPYERGQGWRDALNDAVRAAQHPLLAFCTCDNQYDPSELERMLKTIDLVDLVVGYRVGRAIPFWRLLLDILTIFLSRVVIGVPVAPTVCWFGSEGWGRRWFARWIFGLRVNDPECPYRLARREIFERIPFQSGGSFAQIEMLAKANHLACLIAEEPVTWTPPAISVSEATPFSEDTWRVFREPDFGAWENQQTNPGGEVFRTP